MKFRKGLVSNSSSTSFTIMIPFGLEVPDKDFEDVANKHIEEWDHAFKMGGDEVATELAVKELKEGWQTIRNGGDLQEDSWGIDNERVIENRDRFRALTALAKKYGLVLSTTEIGSDCRGEIKGVDHGFVEGLIRKYKKD